MLNLLSGPLKHTLLPTPLCFDVLTVLFIKKIHLEVIDSAFYFSVRKSYAWINLLQRILPVSHFWCLGTDVSQTPKCFVSYIHQTYFKCVPKVKQNHLLAHVPESNHVLLV